MNILQELEDFINTFNQDNSEDFQIDSIRVEFSKQYKQDDLKELGNWSKIKKSSNILAKLKKRLTDNEITSAWRLEDQNIYYYNMQDAPKYRKATLVIFGMKQYHKEAPKRELISKVLQVLKSVSNVDICLDLPYKPNIEALSKYFTLKPYITKHGVITNTSYINDTGILMIDKITIYNKAHKNNLKNELWRIEAKISIPNFRALMMPLHEFKQITDIARTAHD
ncbi:MAG TPA: hypothetical protein EYH42_07570 [Sulfurovum sp.]|nr:hypothetical protein [Sulfurovum sp.]